MSTFHDQNDDDDLRPEYDFSKLPRGVRGKYYERMQQSLGTVKLAPDVAKAFPDEAAVNEALRVYLREHPTTQASA